MRLSGLRLGPLVLAAWLAAIPVGTADQQGTAASTPAKQPDQVQMRYQISVMEGILERAVEQGARILNRRVQSMMPSMLLWGGTARARGFRLEPYGVFFDVEVPELRRSIAWTFRVLDQNDLGLTSALQSLRQHVETVSDQQARKQLEQALSRVELEMGPMLPGPGGVSALGAPAAAQPVGGRPVQPVVEDPGEAYTNEVKSALVDAMLDFGGGITIGPDEWLTIAARDNEDRGRVTPSDPYEIVTIFLRIRGSDLAALKAGRLTRDEARKRVEVDEF